MLSIKKWVVMTVCLVAGVSGVRAATYEIDPSHSQVGFRIRHIVSRVRGSFNDFSGKVDFDQKKPESLAANVVVKTASVNTANEKRDEHLRSADFFNVQKYPEMTFKTTSVKSTGDGKLDITGDLTMLGVTKPVVLHTDVLGVGNDPWGNERVGFSATGTLNRKDYGMVFNMGDKGGMVIGDDVEILLEVEAVNKLAAKPAPAKKK